ncbi:hypothetical protein [Catellatospora vulcania]|uniref:hypothetical protein n=1 Tax=Catellatospora vulcania TaxID=1460450 RepID=UPI0012D49D6A|nr:hypothetical protein [Catellatospora vulcania]
MNLLTGQAVPIDPTKRTKEQETAYRDQITLLSAQGKLTPAMMSQMGLRTLTVATGKTPVAQAPAAPPTAQGSGVSPMGCSITNPQTGAGAMSVPAPTIVFNGSSQGYQMYATATYKWNSHPEAPSTCKVAVGGVDGIAVALDISVLNDGVSFIGCNIYNKCASTGYLETNGQYGAGWAFQDWATSTLLGGGDTYRGSLTFAFRFRGGLGCVQAFSRYGHSWDSTALNGFGIGPWSISAQWTSTSSNWGTSSQTGRYGC